MKLPWSKKQPANPRPAGMGAVVMSMPAPVPEIVPTSATAGHFRICLHLAG